MENIRLTVSQTLHYAQKNKMHICNGRNEEKYVKPGERSPGWKGVFMKITTEVPVLQDIIVDIVESHLEVAYANQYDDNTSTIHCHIQNKGVDFDVENYTATLRVKKSNGKGFSANIGSKELEGTVLGNVVAFKVPRYLTVSQGKQTCNLEFYEKDHVENGVKYSCTFYLRVSKSALQEEDILDSDYYASVHDEYIKLKTDMTDAITQEQERATQAENTISNNLAAHSADKENPHAVTKTQLGLGNVENKTSAAIREEITKENVTDALGYTPYTPNEVDTMVSALETDKVDKVDGMGLSANNFTDDYKSTLDNISENNLASMKSEITELKKSVSDGKSAVASAITGMGVSTATDDTFETMAGNVEKIKPTINVGGSTSAGVWNGATFTYGQGGGGGSASINGKNTVSSAYSLSPRTTTVGGNAATSDVLSGKTFSSNNAGREVNGTMPNQGTWNYNMWCDSINEGLSVTIPAGYHNGLGKVTCPRSAVSHPARTHLFGDNHQYSHYTVNFHSGTYYTFNNVQQLSSVPMVVMWDSENFDNVIDIALARYNTDGVSYRGECHAWHDGTNVYIQRDKASAYENGKWFAMSVITF